MRTALVVIILALIALAIFNPGMDDFQVFVQTQTERLIQDEMGDGVLSETLSRLGSGLASAHVERITERNNYVFFSTYTIDFDRTSGNQNEWRFLGMAGHFMELERPEL